MKITPANLPDFALAELQPCSVWAHFATLCTIPRASYQEAALRDHLIGWATVRGIAAEVDAVGNLILRKPGSPGCEAMPGVILQGHLDMVCQANAGTAHDFASDPIQAVIREGRVIAEHTTLGADNGIGVALALAALEEPGLVHPPLEVLLTVNEESGMDGARGLAPGTLRGEMLINLDTEEWGHFYLGCAGGVDVEVEGKLESVRPERVEGRTETLYRLEVSGLRGGHSGIDIHLGRGNAIKLLAEVLRGWAERGELRLVGLGGGTARNAIPREAHAVMAVAEAEVSRLAAWMDECLMAWKSRFSGVDDGVKLFLQAVDGECTSLIEPADCNRLLAFLDTAANGVDSVSAEFPGVTDTSSNLGVVALENGVLRATFKVRSLENGRADRLAGELVGHARTHGFSARKDGAYPGWTPNPASPLLALCQQVYTAEFGQAASLQVIHAGLECGLLAASHPHLDMISFGPDIRGAHAPGERVEIASVTHCWTLLKALLRALSGTDAALTLYGTSFCHLCDDAVTVLQTAGVSALWVDVADDDALTERYGVRIPLLRRADGAELGWPFDAAAVRRFAAG